MNHRINVLGFTPKQLMATNMGHHSTIPPATSRGTWPNHVAKYCWAPFVDGPPPWATFIFCWSHRHLFGGMMFIIAFIFVSHVLSTQLQLKLRCFSSKHIMSFVGGPTWFLAFFKRVSKLLNGALKLLLDAWKPSRSVKWSWNHGKYVGTKCSIAS